MVDRIPFVAALFLGLPLSGLCAPGNALLFGSRVYAAQPNSEGESEPTQPAEAAPKKPPSGLEKLDPKSRAKALAALAGLVILGLAMIALMWLGARVTRRYMSPAPFDHQRMKSSLPSPDDWTKKPLVDNSELSGRAEREDSPG